MNKNINFLFRNKREHFFEQIHIECIPPYVLMYRVITPHRKMNWSVFTENLS